MYSNPQSKTDSVRRPAFVWQWNLRVVAFVLVFLPLTIVLGFWQLQRAEEKRLLLDEYRQRQAAAPVAVTGLLEGSDHQYRPVLQSGHFDNNRSILLDNRMRQGQPGYEVVTLFQPEGEDFLVAVNRGWLASGLDRALLPRIPPIAGEVKISGYLYRSPGKPFSLAAEQWQGAWPLLVQNLVIGDLATARGLEIFPWQLRLGPESPGALVTGWPVVNVQPEKHLGYAVQWFAMAIALAVLAIFANSNLAVVLRRHPEANDSEATRRNEE